MNPDKASTSVLLDDREDGELSDDVCSVGDEDQCNDNLLSILCSTNDPEEQLALLQQARLEDISTLAASCIHFLHVVFGMQKDLTEKLTGYKQFIQDWKPFSEMVEKKVTDDSKGKQPKPKKRKLSPPVDIAPHRKEPVSKKTGKSSKLKDDALKVSHTA